MAAAEPEVQRTGTMHTCSGFGWVKFDGGAKLGAELQTAAPTVRCFGLRASRQLGPAPSPAPDAHDDLGGGGGGGEPADERQQFVEVAQQTRAVACFGQLSVIVPPAPSAPWTPCSLRCDGLSFSLERVESRSHGGTPAAAASSSGVQDGLRQQPEVGAVIMSKSLRGVELVTGRMGELLISMRNTACDASLAQRAALDTADAAGRICLQAGRITKRSAENIGFVATWPWQEGGGSE